MKNKKQRKIFLYLLVILGITVGFALLSTTLKINGTAEIKSNTWNIHWDDTSINVTSGSVSASDPVVSTGTNTNDIVSFDVELELPGDFYEFEIDAVNEGSIDGALNLEENWITYTINNQPANLPSYMNFSVTYDDDTTPTSGNVLKAGRSKTYKIRVEYKSNVEEVPSNPQPVTIEVELPYVQHKDNTVTPKTPGDEVCYSTECFYVVSSNTEKTVLTAKYNLLVGNNVSSWTVTGPIAPSTPGYGLQNIDANGTSGSSSEWYGSIPYANKIYKDAYNNDIGYWVNQDKTLKSIYLQHGESFNGNPYPFVYDENSNLYSIINTYTNTLKTLGAPSSTTGRILTYEEANAVKEVKVDNISIIYDGRQAYWLGSANDYWNLWYVYKDGNFYGYNFYFDNGSGVRPAIEVPTSSIN